jgi:hypothetical protein
LVEVAAVEVIVVLVGEAVIVEVNVKPVEDAEEVKDEIEEDVVKLVSLCLYHDTPAFDIADAILYHSLASRLTSDRILAVTLTEDCEFWIVEMSADDVVVVRVWNVVLGLVVVSV